MVGRRAKDFRSGDWNEDLGILLLKAFAAVAPVQRQEDFGLDAVATLLRHDKENRLLYAEDSFYVQLKSGSNINLIYRDEEIQWLRNLQLPLFLGVVRKAESSLGLYPGHKLNALLVGPREFKEIHVRFGEKHPMMQKVGKDGVEVRLGQPLLKFTVQQASAKDFVDVAYRVLKPFLVAEHRNVTNRRIRFCEDITWKTNKQPTVVEGHFVAIRKPVQDDFRSIVESLIPGFHALALHADITKNPDEIKALVALTSELKKAGFDLDSLDTFERRVTVWKPPKGFLDD
jgi:hypothetical protein